MNKTARLGDIDPVIYVPPYNAESPTACCHLQYGDIRLLCPVSGDGLSLSDLQPVSAFTHGASPSADPLFAFAFLQTFTDILHEYLGNVSAATLKENFDVVYQVRSLKLPVILLNVQQLLEETLDSGGHPLTTATNALRDIVLPPSLLSKLLNVAGANITSAINSGSVGGGPFASPIPWRKAGLRYTSNEIYFDVLEELDASVNK